MQPDPKSESFNDKPAAGGVPPPLPASQPPVIGPLPPVVAASPPPQLDHRSSRVRQLLAILLSLCLGLFLADAVVSLVDDSLILFFNLHLLTVIRGLVFLLAVFMAIVIYVLMGL